MSKTAFLFPGQGSQRAGMGRAAAEAFPAAKAVFDEADEALGYSVSRLCFEGPEEELRLTEKTQPAILTCSIATFAVLREMGISPNFAAGHSLGEYSALTAAGSIDFAAAARLVRNRGRYMQEAVPEGEGAMAAILGLDSAVVEEVCRDAARGQVVTPANLNSPGQVVIAGHAQAVERAMDLARDRGARKTVPLAVSAPFHCALMRPALERLAPELDAIPFHDPKFPVINNFAAVEVRRGDEAREGLKHQIPHPVRWEESVRRLIEAGVDRMIEVGPGRVLAGLVKAIDRSIRVDTTTDVESIARLKG